MPAKLDLEEALWLAVPVPSEGDCESGQQLWFKKGPSESLGQGHYFPPILLSGVLGWAACPES